LNLFTIIFLLYLLQKFRQIQRQTAVESDEREITASDFTLRVSHFPNDWPNDTDVDQKIREYFEENSIQGKKVNIQKVSCCYNCNEKIFVLDEIEKKFKEKKKLEAEMLESGSDDNAVTKGIIETIEKDLAELNNRLDRINKEFMDGVGVAPRFTGEAYITYES